MAEVRSGLRHVLALPKVYDAFQGMVGANAWRSRVIGSVVNPMLKEGSRVIDIGCGTADALKHLRDGISYFGFDRNPSYIDTARRRFSKRDATFACKSVGEDDTEGPQTFHLALAFGLMHHLDDPEAIALLTTAKRVTEPEGALVLLDPVYTDKQSWLARYFVSKDRGQNVRTADGYRELCAQVFPAVRVMVDADPLRIPYTGVVIVCSFEPSRVSHGSGA